MRLTNLITMLLSCLLGTVFLSAKLVYANPDSELNSLIIYSSTNNELNEQVYLLDQLVSHYSKSTVTSESNVTNLSNYDYVFYIGLDHKKLDGSFIKSMEGYDGSIIFIGENINQFQQRFPIKDTNQSVNIKEISMGSNHSTFESLKEMKLVTEQSTMEVIIEGFRGNYNYPILISNKKDYYLASTQLDDQIAYYFAKALDTIFNTNRTSYQSSFIKIEDINPTTDVEALTKMTTYLTSNDIPLILSVSPVYESNNEEAHLSDSNELVQKLLSLQSLGGAIVYSYPSFSDSENEEEKRALIEAEILELASYDIYPVAVSFATTSTSISLEDMIIADDYFSILFANGRSSHSAVLKATAPYVNQPSYVDEMVLIPETLGYLNNTDTLLSLKRHHKHLKIVPNATLGISIFPYTKLDILKQGLTDLQVSQKTSWMNLFDRNVSVQTPFLSIESTIDNDIKVVNNMNALQSFMFRHQLSKVEIVLWFVAFIVSLFILAFFIYSVYLKLNLRKSLFAERRGKE
ncbi:DUF2334 domain-containing protein [Paraliobacillus sp. JSM ZJ581]|uniref:DUF2334 domain-containing protein n=1 Tax=Paraliobacillus sp. JSM ZJ581 TaxID=3342118 RepID=UPI0035A877B4